MKLQKGFTLIEIMIVVAILGILAAIAYPNYTEFVRKGKRSDAMQALLAASEAMERYKAANFSYAGVNNNLQSIFNTNVPESGGTYYTLQVRSNATNYVITASDTGTMEGDCNLAITSTGVRTKVSGSNCSKIDW